MFHKIAFHTIELNQGPNVPGSGLREEVEKEEYIDSTEGQKWLVT